MKTLNLGILAHVDAGKTSLTERLLYAAGVLPALGSVDDGTTQTDSLDQERQRGITIRAAVAAFTVDEVTVNLIDTPGHPDFIAEVDRSLSVLDGAVLVVSAVEGVQPQTVVLMRALRRLAVPTLLFVNKIDRAGADPQRVLGAIRQRLSDHAVPLGTAHHVGTPAAAYIPYDSRDARFLDALTGVLIEHDDALLAAAVDDPAGAVDSGELYARLAAQTAAAQVHPVLFGSAATGAGIPALTAALVGLLPAVAGDPDSPPSASVFKVERGAAGQKIAYARMFAGTVRVRQRLRLGPDRVGTVTAVKVFDHGALVTAPAVQAGRIAQLFGLREVRVGDSIGTPPRQAQGALFAPPTLETAVVARHPPQQGALHAALVQLAEQDPLINLRQDDPRQEMFLSLYGEVQKEVLADTLKADYGIDVDFRETTIICIERVNGTGHAVERLADPANPFLATVGLRVQPGPLDSGLTFALAVDLATIPLFVYKTVDAFTAAMTQYIQATLQQGPYGWQVTDATVTMTDCGYTSPATTAADFRKLTPLVLATALHQAGTTVWEPVNRFHLDTPADALTPVLKLLSTHRAVPELPTTAQAWSTIEGTVPAAEVSRLQQQLPGHTHGEGVLQSQFDRYQPHPGSPPRRQRADNNPHNRKEYLRHVLRRL